MALQDGEVLGEQRRSISAIVSNYSPVLGSPLALQHLQHPRARMGERLEQVRLDLVERRLLVVGGVRDGSSMDLRIEQNLNCSYSIVTHGSPKRSMLGRSPATPPAGRGPSRRAAVPSAAQCGSSRDPDPPAGLRSPAQPLPSAAEV